MICPNTVGISPRDSDIAMPEHYRFSLPVKAGDQRQLGELTGAACATLVAEIAERHPGRWCWLPRTCKTPCACTTKFVSSPTVWYSAADWETLPYDSFSPHGDHLLAPVDAVSAPHHAARRADCAGEYPDAARLPAQLFARPCAGDEKASACRAMPCACSWMEPAIDMSIR